MTVLFFVAAAALAFSILYDPERACVYGVASVLATTVLYPKLLTSPGMFRHIGISGSEPAVTTYALVIAVLILLAAPAAGRLSDARVVGPLLLWVVVGSLFFWPHTSEVRAGVFQYGTGVLAWILGFRFSRELIRRPELIRLVSFAIATVMAAELAVVSLQFAGFPVNPMETAAAEILSGRLNGTMGHPNDLGKVTLLLAALSLALSRGSDSRVRFANRFTIGAALAIAVATEGRVVIASIVALVVVWALIQPRDQAPLSRRFAMLSAAALGAMASASVIIARFAEDPTGGVRSTTRDVARQQISENPFPGIGPNTYVSTVGTYDSLTASGVPVHNAALLSFAELGVVGFVTLFAPLCWIICRAMFRRGVPGFGGSFAAALVALAPGLIMIGATGWGILAGSMFPLAMFVLAFLHQPNADLRNPRGRTRASLRQRVEGASPSTHTRALRHEPQGKP